MSFNSIHFPITKSQFLNFTKCVNSFYILNQGLITKQNIQHSGNLEWSEFQDLCRSLFPKAVSIPKSLSKEDQLTETLAAIRERNAIFHGFLENETLSSSIECLVPEPDSSGWVLWDFRSVGSQKQDILRSLYFQKKLLESFQIPVSQIKVIRINSGYVHTSESIDKESYLVIDDVTERIETEKTRFDQEWILFENYKGNPNFPLFMEDFHTCKSPKTCYLDTVCFPDLNRREIFDLREGHDLAKKYYLEGLGSFLEIPEEELTPIQKIQKQSHETGKLYIDFPKMQTYFENVTPKIAFLDFESVNPLLPIFANSRPFQHIPFLFSLHIWDSETDELTHHTYIHEPDGTDPRLFILEHLSKKLQEDITICSFNDFFEKLVIEEATQVYPNFIEWWSTIRPKFIDLALPFKKFWVYHPKQRGKASLKDILPAITDVSHGSLTIKEGQDANYQFLRLLKKHVTDDDKNRVLGDLLRYCEMDTFGLFLIYKKLKNEISISQC
ncbi:hypothetical protein LPTSP3_g06520 [Leptospira kobayashii]|uniref:DUF2779 domain-containing protein n=1 Tax=Leptospira kobayashii TaxID=1917830 RepID=A0ABN6K9U2_9LEPT|nr:DUF2779 domain-containing protein [Leptospira kobayashii]BDA77722.1 hypothetical protein LPTSP3_g06520 [Leptospira kobayashii]